MSLLTASVRELTNARALDVALTDTNGNHVTPFSSPGLPNSTLLAVTSSATSVLILAANVTRRKFIIYNDSTRTLKIAYDATASATVFNHLIPAQSFYESAIGDYTGIINGIWTTANGFARVTELTE